MKKDVVELFCGVGGFRVGLNEINSFDNNGKAIEHGNWNFVWANQYEPSTKKQDAFDCYTTRFGENSCSNEDIAKVDKSLIPDHTLLTGGFPCLTGDALIWTKKGEKELIKVKVGDFVLSHDGRYHRVLNFFEQGVKMTYKIRVKGYRPVIATANHKFLVREKYVTKDAKCISTHFSEPKWMQVDEMKGKNVYFAGMFPHLIGTEYFSRSFDWKPLESITEYKELPVYDIEVQDTHSFVVNGRYISHNCQDYSVAHSLSKSKGIEGKKGVLFWQIADILKEKQPPFGLFENVDRLLKSPAKQRGRDFGIMLRTFYDLGYNAEWYVVNAADYGAPQRRRRIFIFIWKKDTKYNQQFILDKAKDSGLLKEAFPFFAEDTDFEKIDLTTFEDVVDVSDNGQFNFQSYGLMINGKVTTYTPVPLRETGKTLGDIQEKGKDLSKYILDDKRLEQFKYLRGNKKISRKRPDGTEYFYTEGAMSPYDSLNLPSRTMLTSEGSTSRCTHILPDDKTDKLRILTPIEAERLQGFPDNWTNTGMTERKRYFMMGNALVTSMITRIGKVLDKVISEEDAK